LTVRIPTLKRDYGEIGPRFLLPLGEEVFRWGATHESDVLDQGPCPAARKRLEEELALKPGIGAFEVLAHHGGVRPSSRTGSPLVLRHPDEPGWSLFNGFGGRGVSVIPRWLDRLDP
jgi:glycine/D-amino acid oxidase-like deaminating enzyme